MSERPNFAEVLAEHRFMARNAAGRMGCRGCTWTTHLTPGTDRAWAAYADHLAAVLNAEVDRWLADEGTREVVAVAFGWHLTERTYDSGCTLACGYDGDEMDDHLAAAALAALTTPTVPTAEEER